MRRVGQDADCVRQRIQVPGVRRAGGAGLASRPNSTGGRTHLVIETRVCYNKLIMPFGSVTIQAVRVRYPACKISKPKEYNLMNLIKRELVDYRILLRNIPGLVLCLFVVSVFMMNLLAN